MRSDGLLFDGEPAERSLRKSRWPALLDLAQGVTGLLLVLFMAGHMVLVSSILVSKDLMYLVARAFEGYYLFGESRPWFVSIAVMVVLLLFIAHAGLAMRKFPSDYRQYRAFRDHRRRLRHTDTTLWWVQVVTGFAMVFLGSAHLIFMLVHPDQIGPYASADRVWGGGWPIGLLLLLAVELHAGIGIYRLAVKWKGLRTEAGEGIRRETLRTAIAVITAGFLLIGLATLATYMKVGYDHRDRAGERYVPVAAVDLARPERTT